MCFLLTFVDFLGRLFTLTMSKQGETVYYKSPTMRDVDDRIGDIQALITDKQVHGPNSGVHNVDVVVAAAALTG